MIDKHTILWVDDEIDLLKPHIMLLEERGYAVTTSTSGEDALERFRKGAFDLVFLDEMMPGIGGLATLERIKEFSPATPVVMVTKSEAESLMEDAIGRSIADYLTKPVNPTQILSVCKKFLEGKRLTGEHLSRRYTTEFSRLSSQIMSAVDFSDWTTIFSSIVARELEFDKHPELGLGQMLADQKREANSEFSKFIEREYPGWVAADRGKRPVLSPDVFDQYVLPRLDNNRSVFCFIVDCLRLDQWMGMEELLRDYFTIERNVYCSILPTATVYARNALFSGLFPSDIEKYFPDLWVTSDDDEASLNRYEEQLLGSLLERKRIKLAKEPKYIKIYDAEFGRSIEGKILSFVPNQLTAIVVDFVDMLSHSRSDSPILKEIAPDESAYRALTRTWFEHSSFFGMLRTLSKQKNVEIIITTDHGSIRSMRGAKVMGDRETATNLRYKYGRNVKAEPKQAMLVRNPLDLKLPKRGISNYIIAKEDYYFVYPTNYHEYLNYYRDSFQHGGISMEEMIVPVVRLSSK